MVRFLAALGLTGCIWAEPAHFSISQVLGSAFPTHLTAAQGEGKIAWVSNTRGVVNIMVAEPLDYRARKVTSYAEDDGQDIVELHWTPDARALVYVRGEGPNGSGEIPNPALDPNGREQTIWIVGLDSSSPRRLAEGNSVAVSPHGDRIAYTRRGQIWCMSLSEKADPAQPFHTRGRLSRPVWSPDVAHLAFVSNRGDHSFVGVYDLNPPMLRFLDPSTDFDSEPEWSPDSRQIAFIREPSRGKGPIYGARRADEPWSIHVADAATGAGREIWKAREGAGSVFREVVADHQLLWAAGNRLIFPWEGDGWTHLYSIAAEGGKASLLTPGDFEVEFAALAPDGREVLFNSNQGDIDRRTYGG
jgi:Tol biopolymer transport system component